MSRPPPARYVETRKATIKFKSANRSSATYALPLSLFPSLPTAAMAEQARKQNALARPLLLSVRLFAKARATNTYSVEIHCGYCLRGVFLLCCSRCRLRPEQGKGEGKGKHRRGQEARPNSPPLPFPV